MSGSDCIASYFITAEYTEQTTSEMHGADDSFTIGRRHRRQNTVLSRHTYVNQIAMNLGTCLFQSLKVIIIL